MRIKILLALLFPLVLKAQLQVHRFFSDNMVLQRDQAISFGGSGIPGNRVNVSFGREHRRTTVKPDGSWNVLFKKRKADRQPQQVVITSGRERVELDNVLIGDVWICTGQSNMEWAFSREMHFREEQQLTNQPLLRFFNADFAGKYVYKSLYTDSVKKRLNKDDFYRGTWQQCDSNTVRPMSAVAYYFGKAIAASEDIPVGLINLSIGGAPIETFISYESLQHEFVSKTQGNWLENDELPEWTRQRGKENLGNKYNGSDSSGPDHAYKPGFAYKAGIELLQSHKVKGVIFYQGESNSLELPRVMEYRKLMTVLIADYRKLWKQQDLPFYWVQLSSIDTAKYQSQFWPEFRNEQRLLLNELSHVGMAVSSDLGAKNDVHPTNKRDIGQRLARWTLHDVYGRDIIPSGPLPVKAEARNGVLRITFNYAGKQLATTDTQLPRGFTIEDKDVPAIIKGTTIEMPLTGKPGYVCYGWSPFTTANLCNDEMLPASTFKLKIDYLNSNQ
jgi:sialate O-acetylesterase